MNLKTTYWSKDVKQCCCHWVFCFSVDKKAADMWMKSYQLFFFLCVCEKVSSGQGQLGSRWASVGYAPSHSHILLSGHRVTVIQTHIARRHKRGGGECDGTTSPETWWWTHSENILNSESIRRAFTSAVLSDLSDLSVKIHWKHQVFHISSSR